mmetsp:Transcript_74519/g.210508  ORF Transcript_74519/g.210508 Transcript_74519/m.210508 type:complete len:380 (+) Transcript_74519:828-1967(+)
MLRRSRRHLHGAVQACGGRREQRPVPARSQGERVFADHGAGRKRAGQVLAHRRRRRQPAVGDQLHGHFRMEGPQKAFLGGDVRRPVGPDADCGPGERAQVLRPWHLEQVRCAGDGSGGPGVRVRVQDDRAWHGPGGVLFHPRPRHGAANLPRGGPVPGGVRPHHGPGRGRLRRQGGVRERRVAGARRARGGHAEVAGLRREEGGGHPPPRERGWAHHADGGRRARDEDLPELQGAAGAHVSDLPDLHRGPRAHAARRGQSRGLQVQVAPAEAVVRALPDRRGRGPVEGDVPERRRGAARHPRRHPPGPRRRRRRPAVARQGRLRRGLQHHAGHERARPAQDGLVDGRAGGAAVSPAPGTARSSRRLDHRPPPPHRDLHC